MYSSVDKKIEFTIDLKLNEKEAKTLVRYLEESIKETNTVGDLIENHSKRNFIGTLNGALERISRGLEN